VSQPATTSLTCVLPFPANWGPLDAQRPLDEGIVRTLWMTPEEVRASAARHRSPLVLRCIEDHLAGQRFPLSLIHADVESMP
jgi:hypothetical protein